MRIRIAQACCALVVLCVAGAASAQMPLPSAAPPSGAELFKRQCSTCHTTNASDPQRQGPTLAGVYDRKAGSVAGFHYSPGFAQANWTWDQAHLDTWLTNPQGMIPGAIMPYKQAKSETRAAIIDYLKGVH